MLLFCKTKTQNLSKDTPPLAFKIHYKIKLNNFPRHMIEYI